MAVFHAVVTVLWILASSTDVALAKQRSLSKAEATFYRDHLEPRKDEWHLNRVAHSQPCLAVSDPRTKVVFSAKHKSGTSLATRLTEELYLLTKAPVPTYKMYVHGRIHWCVDSVLTAGAPWNVTAELVSMTRSPIEMVISGYYYHLDGVESWTRAPIAESSLLSGLISQSKFFQDVMRRYKLNAEHNSLQDTLNCSTLEEGLQISMVVAHDQISGMLDEMRSFRDVSNGHIAAMEDFEADFDGLVRRIAGWAGVDPDAFSRVMAAHNVYAQAETVHSNHVHVDSKFRSLKQMCRELLQTKPAYLHVRLQEQRYRALYKELLEQDLH